MSDEWLPDHDLRKAVESFSDRNRAPSGLRGQTSYAITFHLGFEMYIRPRTGSPGTDPIDETVMMDQILYRPCAPITELVPQDGVIVGLYLIGSVLPGTADKYSASHAPTPDPWMGVRCSVPLLGNVDQVYLANMIVDPLPPASALIVRGGQLITAWIDGEGASEHSQPPVAKYPPDVSAKGVLILRVQMADNVSAGRVANEVAEIPPV